jgi:hypothetical protein
VEERFDTPEVSSKLRAGWLEASSQKGPPETSPPNRTDERRAAEIDSSGSHEKLHESIARAW